MTIQPMDLAPTDWATGKEGLAVESLRTAFKSLQEALNEAHDAGVDVAFEQRGVWFVGESGSRPRIFWTASKVLA